MPLNTADTDRINRAQPRDDGTVPETERINPLYAHPGRQLQEPWVVLGYDWTMDTVQQLINSSLYLQITMNDAIQREPGLVPRLQGKQIPLTFDRLYALVIYSRGDVVHDVKCYRCGHFASSIFTLCVSKHGVAHGACAADIWARRGNSCCYNQMHGMLVDPNNSGRSARIQLRNQAILSRVQLQSGEGGQEQVVYSQGGLLTNRRTVQLIENLHRTSVPLWYHSSAVVPEEPAPDGPAPEGAERAQEELGSRENPIAIDDDDEEVLGSSLDMVVLLLDHGSNIDALNMEGCSPLHLAAAYRRPNIIKALISRGAKRHIVDCNGRRAVDWALEDSSCIAELDPLASTVTVTRIQDVNKPCLWRSVKTFACRARTEPKLPSLLSFLSRSLLLLNDVESAQIALEQAAEANEDHSKVKHEYFCHICSKDYLPIEGILFVCKTCTLFSVCQACFDKSGGSPKNRICSHCDFVQAPRECWKFLRGDVVDVSGLILSEWLLGLEEKYSQLLANHDLDLS